MGCCGEPTHKDDQYTNRPQVPTAGVVQQQPTAQAAAQMYEKPALLTPTGPSPPPPSFHPNHHPSIHSGPGSGSQWGHGSPSPPPGSIQQGMRPMSSINASMQMIPPSLVYDAPGRGNQVGLPTPLYQPSPIHVPPRHASTSPSLASSVTQMIASMPRNEYGGPPDEGRMSISIDFGTTFSGVAYASARIASGVVQQILHWPGSLETFRKVPTCLLYDEHGQVMAWGLEAKNASPMPGTLQCEWFKLFLEPRALRDESAIDPRLPQLPPGKTAMNLIIDFLTCLWEYAKEEITREIGAVADLNAADVVVTCPAAWDAKGCDLMRAAAIEAGLVQSARAGDVHWRDRLRIITEPEAAAVHCVRLTDLHKLRPSQNFMICDAGGGTVDLACYKIIGQVGQNGNLEIAEMCARSGANCGSLFLDLRFRELVQTLLAEHPAHLDPASLAYFMHSFSQTDKLAFRGEVDDETYFHFTCFNVQDQHDPSVGLINGELAIPGILIRREVFDPVVNQVLEMIEEQAGKIEQRIDALLLVGGFAGSEYLFRKDKFSGKMKVIARPSDADTATVRGAAQYGLSRKTIVSTVIAPRAYIMKVKLPAEPEDWLKRPAYIKENKASVPICENRLQYLVMKGAILRKGQRVKTKFCKFSQNGQDCKFVAGETTELCKWTVDLSSLPTFQQNAGIPQPNGFYTEFELGLEMDSVELILDRARRERKVVRAVGVGHSPSDLACTSGYMLRTTKLNRLLEVHVDKRYIVAEAGITLDALHAALAKHGLAMINVGSISDQTLGGIITTATHGTGINYGVISTHVIALSLLLADGTRVYCSRQERPDLFIASICGLGSTGLILSVTLQVEPAFRLKETQRTLAFQDCVRNIDALVKASQHVRLWWFPAADTIRVSSADRTVEPKRAVGSWLWHSLLGFHVLQFILFLGRYFLSLNVFATRFAAWLVHDQVVAVDDSYRIFNMDVRVSFLFRPPCPPPSGDQPTRKYPQHTTEWAIPYENTQPCLQDLHSWLAHEFADPCGLRPHFPIEIRFSDSDDIWLSPSNGQQTCWIGIVQYKPYGLEVPYHDLFERFEAILLRHGGRPHWAKAHPLRPDTLRALYPRFDDFVRVLRDVDPHGIFRNEYVQRHIFGKTGPEFDGAVFRNHADLRR
ncbi:D-arabinono-1,4-lactone oxidase-domain-containing protein [Lanmaoa asiatica]|nr:D-arabinono-1,4-lactone oxidase-domain-containing protein [Lanmaoa asiatica]